MNLNDHLAIERTKLANERTILAYSRTSLMVFLTGISFIKIFDTAYLIIVGMILIPLSVIIIILGILSYRRTKNKIMEFIEKPVN
jgi:putative membrane protein